MKPDYEIRSIKQLNSIVKFHNHKDKECIKRIGYFFSEKKFNQLND